MRSSRYILALLSAVLLGSGMSRQVGWASLASGSALGQQEDQPTSSGGAPAQLVLAENRRSQFKIVRADDASERTLLAAQELQSFLKQVTSVELPIVSDTAPMGEREIIIGANAHLRQLPTTIDVAKVGAQGFTIRTVGRHLVIAGGAEWGNLYGVYTFLEDYVGCRWYTSTASCIPSRPTLTIGAIDDTQVPAFAWRRTSYRDIAPPQAQPIAMRLKLNGGGDWGLWCHSFFELVPPSEYFEKHPEYFSLVNGRRVRDRQLCLTNLDVVKLTAQKLREMIGKQPHLPYWSISQMDWAGYCQCPDCRAADDREGTPMGSLLPFINTIAAQFPDKIITTLAYQYSRKPPRTLQALPNVGIQLCTLELNRSQSFATDGRPDSVAFRDDLSRWAGISRNIVIWDYTIQFANLVSPFPNLRVLKPNLQYLAGHHVMGTYSQANREIGGEFAELRGYLLAKLMWNPNQDVTKLMDDFLDGYYGPAGKPIRRYIDLMHDALEKSGTDLKIFGGPKDHSSDYLSPDLIAQYDRLFDEAQRLVADDPALASRVQVARMPLRYAKLRLGVGEVNSRLKEADRLFATAERQGLEMFDEWNLTTAKFEQETYDKLHAEKDKVPGVVSPDGPDRARDAVMSFEEYAAVPLPPMPHVLVLMADAGRLFYFGTRHTFDPNDWQIRAIEDYWRQFRPTLALNEGGDPPALESQEETVQRFGEAGLVRFLAKAGRVPVRSLEPPSDEEHTLLQRDFSVEQIKVFYVLRGVVQFRKSRNDERVEGFVERVVQGLSREQGLEGPPCSLAEFERSYVRLFRAPTDWRVVPEDWFDPVISRPESYTNRISRQLSEFRDRYMVKLLIREVERGNRVFAVVGGSHVIMQERALRAALGGAPGRTTDPGLERAKETARR